MTYYTMTEQLTARTDMGWNLKAVLINITNKIEIPKDKLNGQDFYTFSVSNVSLEMGMPESTTSDQFKILEKLGVIKFVGYKITSHGKVKLFKAEMGILSKVVSGEIKFKTEKRKEPATATVEPITAIVEATTATVIPTTGIVGATTGIVTSIQIEQANGSASNCNTQRVAAQIEQTEPELKIAASSNVDWVKELQAELKMDAKIADAVDYKSLSRTCSTMPANRDKIENN